MPRFYLELEDLKGGQSVLSRVSQEGVLVGGGWGGEKVNERECWEERK